MTATKPVLLTRFTAVRCTIVDGCERKLSEIADRDVTLSDAAIEPCSSQRLISRMLRNLKAIYATVGRHRVCSCPSSAD